MFTSSINLSENIKESSVQIPLESDQFLCAQLIEANGAGKRAVLFMHGWSGLRNGPQNLFVTIARRLAFVGYSSLRFDFRGRGESSGKGLDITLADMVSDCTAAAEYLQKNCGVSKIILFGICSGGNTAIGSINNIPAVESLILLSVYPFAEAEGFNKNLQKTKSSLKIYLGKIFEVNTWKKFIRGEIYWKSVASVIFGHFKKKPNNPKANEHFGSKHPMVSLIQRKIPSLMIYGSADPETAGSIKYFTEFKDRHKLPIQFYEITGANHNFYSQKWADEIVESAVKFLNKQRST